MKHYVEIDPVTGRILAVGTCPDGAILPAGAFLTSAYCPGFSGYVEDGKMVALPPQASPEHEFDWVAKKWFDPRTLQDLRGAKWEQVKQWREAALTAPLVTPYGIFDATPAAQDNITRAVLLANNLTALGHPVAINFTLFDNSIKVLDAAAMIQVSLLLGGRVQLVRDRATALRMQIDAATTAAEVDAITWDSNA